MSEHLPHFESVEFDPGSESDAGSGYSYHDYYGEDGDSADDEIGADYAEEIWNENQKRTSFTEAAG